MNVEVIYTVPNEYTTIYDVIKNTDHIPTLEEWLHDIECDEERKILEKGLKRGSFTFREVSDGV